MSIVKNKAEFMKCLQEANVNVKKCFARRVKNVIWDLHFEVLRNTPVWSGNVVGNYIWSVGVPNFDWEPAVDSGDPGHTNLMELGEEPRRAANEERSYFTLEELVYDNPYQTFFLNNNDPDFRELEDGQIPPDPLRQRTPPGGMVGLAMAFVKYRLAAGQI